MLINKNKNTLFCLYLISIYRLPGGIVLDEYIIEIAGMSVINMQLFVTSPRYSVEG